MARDWQHLGYFPENQPMADALNQAGVGVGACAGLDADRRQFSLWGDLNSRRVPGYEWTFTQTPGGDVTTVANASEAISCVVTQNIHDQWVLLCYMPE